MSRFNSDIDAIMFLEGGTMPDNLDSHEDDNVDLSVDAMQRLIDSGVVWQLQGSYGRAAAALIDAGLCHR